MQLTINPALEAMNPGGGSFHWLFHNSENRSKTKPKFIQYIGTEAWQEVANLQKAKKSNYKLVNPWYSNARTFSPSKIKCIVSALYHRPYVRLEKQQGW